tara:strand:+ start:13426 stop:15675 length:2250 start_codon:yes stop_codon:yes gene_type:complete
MKNHYFLLPIGLLTTILSCLTTYLYSLIIGLGILMIAISKKKHTTLSILVFILWIILINYYISTQKNQRLSIINQYPTSKQTQFIGTLTYHHKNKVIITIKEGFQIRGFLPKKHTYKLQLGDTVSINGSYTKPSIASNPGQHNKLTYALYHKKLGTIAIKTIKTIKKGSPFNTHYMCFKVKEYIIKQHQKSMTNPHASIYSALIFGENYSELDHKYKQLFKKAGLIHAIVVSGSQVSLVLGLCHIILNGLGLYRHYQLIILIPISIFFYILTGGGESVLRAILMAKLMFILKFGFGYKSSPLHVISLTALIMFLIDPFIIYKMGAILSFLATFSLVFGTDIVQKKLPHQLPKIIKNILSIGMAPWLFTTPLLILKFHSLPLGSLISNILLINIIEIIVLLGFTATCLGIICFPLAFLIHQVSWLCIQIIIIVSNEVSSLPLSDIPINHHNLNTCLFLLATWLVFKTNYTLKTKTYSCIGLILIGMNIYYFQYHRTAIITHLDIGQGDATLIKTNQLTCLIDTGPPYDKRLGSITYNVLLPALRYYGIRQLDLLIITHFDKDHAGNLKSLLANIPIKTILHNGNLINYLNKHKLTIPKNTHEETVCNQNELNYKTLQFKFLNPCQHPHQTNKNNQSLVFKLSKHPYSILFTGDIEEQTEYTLLKNNLPDLKSTLLKVGHHGSKTSTNKLFLKSIKPQQSIISAGKNNRYNHPHSSVISRLKHYGKIWRTDQTGAIIIKLSKTLSIQSFLN